MSNVQTQLQQALAAHQQGRLQEAEAAYRAVLKQIPNNFDALHLLGVLHTQQGQLDQAIELLKRAVKANQKHAGAQANLGTAQLGLGLFQNALMSYDRALVLAPRDAEALFNRGNTLKIMKRYADALASYNKTLLIAPQHLGALVNRGNVLQELENYQDALASYETALSIQPNSIAALVGYSHTQHKSGNFPAAVQAAMNALAIEESINTKATFLTAVQGLVINKHEGNDFAQLTIRAISESWGDPHDLAPTIIGFIRQVPSVKRCIERTLRAWPNKLSLEDLFADDLLNVTQDKLLLCLLENIPSCVVEIEKFLTLTRYALLQNASLLDPAPNQNLLNFSGALAKQCFLNEYVFYCDEAELKLAKNLQQKLESALNARQPIPSLWITVYASYFPLHTLAGASQLQQIVLPASIKDLVQQQIEEPLEELSYANNITRLTAVSGDVSKLVKQQYEENPYPRWTKLSLQREKTTPHQHLSTTFPWLDIKPNTPHTQLDYLIAGCGTGRQAIDVAQSYDISKLVAIDLSTRSLGYALRKTAELGITHIEYAQADIMELGTTGWTFDVIESVGVLHHMANPVAGWRVLTSMLNPHGFMRLGFYSEIARRNLNVDQNTLSSAEDIRALRHEMMSQSGHSQYADIFNMRDFYGTSECRDLLFHVQEHRFNLIQLKEILAELGLKLLGFQLPEQVMKQYTRRFPEDKTRNNLDCWHVFEQENPYTFISMYQFWVQKIS